MRNLLADKVKYYSNFANSMYAEYRKLKYGIDTCRKTGKRYIDEIRKDIVNYQANDDGEALCQVSINHMSWLPVYYPSGDTSCQYTPPWCDMSKYQIQRCNTGPTGIGMAYAGQTAGANLIEVNTGGCITRINVNPSIVINNNNGAPNFVYSQNCADPQLVWTIVHNLGYVPNVWIEDCSIPATNISGTTHVIDNNSITITFSTPQAGIAYLS